MHCAAGRLEEDISSLKKDSLRDGIPFYETTKHTLMSSLRTSTFPGVTSDQYMKLPLTRMEPTCPTEWVASVAKTEFVFQLGKVNLTSRGDASRENGTVLDKGRYFKEGTRNSAVKVGPVKDRIANNDI